MPPCRGGFDGIPLPQAGPTAGSRSLRERLVPRVRVSPAQRAPRWRGTSRRRQPVRSVGTPPPDVPGDPLIREAPSGSLHRRGGYVRHPFCGSSALSRNKEEYRSQPFLSRFQATLRSVETYGSGRSFQAFAGGREAVFGAEAPRSGGCRVRDRACERGGDRRALGPWRQPAAWLGGRAVHEHRADHRVARRLSRADAGGAARPVAGGGACGWASTA